MRCRQRFSERIEGNAGTRFILRRKGCLRCSADWVGYNKRQGRDDSIKQFSIQHHQGRIQDFVKVDPASHIMIEGPVP